MKNRRQITTVIQSAYPRLSRSQKKVADYILENPIRVFELCIEELAEITEISRSSVLRFCKQIGCEGYKDLQLLIARPVTKLTENALEDKIIRWCLAGSEQSILETFEQLDYELFSQAVSMSAKATRVLWYGAGDSASLAQSADYKCALLGIDSHYFGDPMKLMSSLTLLDATQVMIIISCRGKGEHIVRPIKSVLKIGVPCLAVTSDCMSWLAKNATISLFAAARIASFSESIFTIRAGHEAMVNALILNTARERSFPLDSIV